ncbi:hypothetical protein V8C86DRAFT_304872 [Haematococcus lacustris]
MPGAKRSHANPDGKSPGTKRVAGGSSALQTRKESAKQLEAEEQCDREARCTVDNGKDPSTSGSKDNSGSSSGSSSDSEEVGKGSAQPAAEGLTANQCKPMESSVLGSLVAHVVCLTQASAPPVACSSILFHTLSQAAVHAGVMPTSGVGPSVHSGGQEQSSRPCVLVACTMSWQQAYCFGCRLGAHIDTPIESTAYPINTLGRYQSASIP